MRRPKPDFTTAIATRKAITTSSTLALAKPAKAFAGEGAVKATVQTERLDDINGVFDRMRAGQIEGRVVLDFGN